MAEYSWWAKKSVRQKPGELKSPSGKKRILQTKDRPRGLSSRTQGKETLWLRTLRLQKTEAWGGGGGGVFGGGGGGGGVVRVSTIKFVSG